MQDLDKFKNEMNLSGKNVYVGHRYVPKIMGDWDNTKIYEPLSIVQYQGNSFTSRQYVPSGVELTNEEYWASTGNYNAQVEQYRQDVRNLEEDTNNLNDEVVNARNGEPSLNDRLEKEKQEVTTQLSQAAIFVESFEGTDTEKIQSALNVGEGKKIRLKDSKTYVIDSSIVGTSDVEIIGNNTTIKVADNTRILNGMLDFDGKKNVKITGVTFDMNMANMPVYQAGEYNTSTFNIGVNFKNCNGIKEITGCKFINLYNMSIQVYGGSDLLIIRDNIFKSLAQNQNQKATHIWMLSIPKTSTVIIENNKFENDAYTLASLGVNGIFMAGVKAKTTINNNYMNYVGRNNEGSHRLLPIDLYGDCENVTISNNKIDNAKYGFVRVHNCKNVFIEGNSVYYTGELLPEPLIIIVNDTVYTPEKNCENIKVSNNQFYASSNSRVMDAIMLYTYDWGQPLVNITIENNAFHGYISRAIRMHFGYKNIVVKGNKCFPYTGVTPEEFLWLSRMAWNPIETTVMESSVISSELKIYDNQWQNRNKGILIEKGTHTGTVETINIESNNLKGINGFIGIHVKELDSFIVNNFLSGYSSGIRIDGSRLSTVMNNNLSNTLYNIYKTEATNVVLTDNYQDGVLIHSNTKKGTKIYHGDGSTTKTFPHELESTPTFFQITPSSVDAGAAGIKFVTADETNLIVTFENALTEGVNNIKLTWSAEL